MDYWGLKEKKGIVLDFDGTICHLFSGFDLQSTIHYLKIKLDPLGVSFDNNYDAFDVFDVIRNQLVDSKQLESAFIVADEVLRQAEMNAIETCTIIDHSAEFISILLHEGYKVGISTNNSSECVLKLICNHMLKNPTINKVSNNLVSAFKSIPVCGRVGTHPELMKPNPWSLLQVADEMDLSIKDICFIGDSLRDYEASVAADCQFIAFGPTARKKERFKTKMEERLIISDFEDLIAIVS